MVPVASLDWGNIEASLEDCGFAVLREILSPSECESLRALYPDDTRFRARVDMARFRFGRGEYKYFAPPLPPLVDTLRHDLYASLAPIASRWRVRLNPPGRVLPGREAPRSGFPATLDAFLKTCHAARQCRPTPLLLSYGAGDYNCLHQDVYGDVAFPLQVVFMLTRPGDDYHGGDLLLIEQRPRAQSRGHAIRASQGAGIVFATRERPVTGTRGDYRVVMRHGVSTITSGSRMSLGIIFHDAR
jgi:hypothetical protein